MINIDLAKYRRIIRDSDLQSYSGQVKHVIGLTIESDGPVSKIGDVCKIYSLNGESFILAEVVGFRDSKVILVPYSHLEGIGQGSRIISTKSAIRIPVGHDLQGRILDGLGNPIDGKGAVNIDKYYGLDNMPPDPLSRARINTSMPLGVKAIDGMLTCGRGQRVGIFAGSGVGKSTLLGMITRNTHADINVIALVGERGREVKEFIEKDLKDEGMKRSIIVVATSDQSPILRMKSALTATAIAEYFRDQGANVLLLMDSVTRFANAQREIGMAIGEPPVSRGFTPSVFVQLSRLLERSGNSGKGSITGLYTVLVDGDDMNEPVADAVRGILDGHIVLSRSLAARNHYPAIDILASVSRLMPDIAAKEHLKHADEVKRMLAVYEDAQDLINIGAYKKGANPEIDEAIRVMPAINGFLRQQVDQRYDFDETLRMLAKVME